MCGIPATVTRKAELVVELLRHAQDETKHRAVMTRLLEKQTATELRHWISMQRRFGYAVPPSDVMRRGRAAIVLAIIEVDRPIRTPTAAHPDCGVHPGLETDVKLASDTALVAFDPSTPAAAHPDWGVHPGLERDVEHASETALVVFDPSGAPARMEQKLRKRWRKLAGKATAAASRKSLPRHVRQLVAKLLQDHPDHTVAALREAAGKQVEVSLVGKYRYLFDKALLKPTAMPIRKRRYRKRWDLAVARQRPLAHAERAG